MAVADPAYMTEDELLAGITDALTIGGWTWMHIIRSDGVTMGHPGLPDVLAAHHDLPFVLTWELKSARGDVRLDQYRWLAAFKGARDVDARIIRPVDYDRALEVIIHRRDPRDVWAA